MTNNLDNCGKGNIANAGNIDISGNNFIISNKNINVTVNKKPKQPLSSLGQRLNRAIKAKGVSPYKIEQIFGISRFLICEYIDGTSEPSLKNIAILADFLNVSLDWLVRGDDYRMQGKSSVHLEKRIEDLERLLKMKL